MFLIFPFLQVVVLEKRPPIWDIYLGSLPILILPGILVAIAVATYFAAKKRWKAAEELRSEQRYEIGPDGIRVDAVGASGFIEWRLIKSADLADGWAYLKTAQNVYYYFPLSVVPMADTFTDLVLEKITDVRRFKPPAGK